MINLYFIRVFALQVNEARKHVAILRRSGNWRTKINFLPSNDRAEIQFRPAQQDKIILQEPTILDVQNYNQTGLCFHFFIRYVQVFLSVNLA